MLEFARRFDNCCQPGEVRRTLGKSQTPPPMYQGTNSLINRDSDPDNTATFVCCWSSLFVVFVGGNEQKKIGPVRGQIQRLFSGLTEKFLIPIKYRNCNFFSVS